MTEEFAEDAIDMKGYYLKIATARNNEPYVLLMRLQYKPGHRAEAMPVPIMWSETYRTLYGAKNLIRIMRNAKARSIYNTVPKRNPKQEYPRAMAHNNQILMHGSVNYPHIVQKLVEELGRLDWAYMEVRE